MNVNVKAMPPGHRSLPAELRSPAWGGRHLGWDRLLRSADVMQSRGGALSGVGYYDPDGIWYDDPVGIDPYVSVDPIPFPDYSDLDSLYQISANAGIPVWQDPNFGAALSRQSGLTIQQTAPAGSNPSAPAGMEWLTVADKLNNSLLKILVASKPGTYMQQLPNGMVLYSQQPGATNLPGLVPGGSSGGSVTTPLGSASFSGAVPLLIGGLVLLMVMGKR